MPSAVIKDHRYDPQSRTLFITFPSGELYAYRDVEPETYAEMQRAQSKGRFFSRRIRPAYPYGKVIDPKAVAIRPPLAGS